MLCMLPLRGVSVRRLDRCIPSFSPSRLCFPLFLLHFCHLCHTKVPIHRTFTSFTVCLPAGSTSASSFARTFSSLPQVCASESEYVCLQIERVYSHSLIPLCMVLWCVVGSVPLGRACSCMLVLAVDVLSPVGSAYALLGLSPSYGAAVFFSSLSLVLFAGVVAVCCLRGLGAGGFARSLLASPFPPLPPWLSLGLFWSS